MRYEDIFKPENVMTLARLTDKVQKRLDPKRGEPSWEDFNNMRKKVFEEEMKLVG